MLIKYARFLFFLIIFVFLNSTSLFANDLYEKLNKLKWVTYNPTNCDLTKNINPTISSIKADLLTLQSAGFDGIITYSNSEIYGSIPAIARSMGFKGIIVGIWDVENGNEWQNAVAVQRYVDGYCLGNEGLGKSYDFEKLSAKLKQLKKETGLPVTTTEEFGDYSERRLIQLGDWIFPNVHPVFANVTQPQEAANWIKEKYKILCAINTFNKRILIKEAGFPTAGESYATQQNQSIFFKALELNNVPFAYFEAYDQPWKAHLPIEPYWGLFDKDRIPKIFMQEKIDALKPRPPNSGQANLK